MHVAPLGQGFKPRETAKEQFGGTRLNCDLASGSVDCAVKPDHPGDWDSLEGSFECSYNFLASKRGAFSILL